MDELNSEFRRLLVSSGWTQARAAVELRLDATTVSRYVTSDVRPSQTVLRLFSELIREPLVIAGLRTPIQSDHWRLEHIEQKLIGALRSLPADPRRRLMDAVIQISEIGGSMPGKRAETEAEISSGRIALAAEDALSAGVEILRDRHRADPPSSEAQSSTHPTAMPVGDVRRRKGGQRSSTKSDSKG